MKEQNITIVQMLHTLHFNLQLMQPEGQDVILLILMQYIKLP